MRWVRGGMQLITLDVVETVEAFAAIPSALPALIESMLPQLKMALAVRGCQALECPRARDDQRSSLLFCERLPA